MAGMMTTKVYCDERGHPLVLGPGDFRVRSEGDEFRAVFFDGKKTHEGPAVLSPNEAIEVLVYEMEEQGVDWRNA